MAGADRMTIELVESLGLRISRSEVSRVCAALDEHVDASGRGRWRAATRRPAREGRTAQASDVNFRSSLMATSLQVFIDGPRAAGPSSEECDPEEQLGPGDISQRVLHGDANLLPRTAHDPLL